MKFLTYRQFPEREQAENFAAILKENGIPFTITEDRDNLDSIYGDRQFQRMFLVKVRDTDFEKTDKALLEKNQHSLEDVEPDHYLFSFSDEELYEIIARRDEWNEFDFLLAQKILRDRGREVNESTVSTLRAKRIEELAKPDKNQGIWIYAGYFSACAGGLLGIFIGWHLRTFKKTLPDGTRVHVYTDKDRKHGSIILAVGITMTAIWSWFGYGFWLYDALWLF
jgi:hypothetical protein